MTRRGLALALILCAGSLVSSAPTRAATAPLLGQAIKTSISFLGGGARWVTGNGETIVSGQQDGIPRVRSFSLSTGQAVEVGVTDSTGAAAYSQMAEAANGTSDDGRWVLFNGGSFGYDSNFPSVQSTAYLRDTVTSDTIVVPFPADHAVAVSSDGMKVLFWSVTPGITTNPPGTLAYGSGYRSVYIWDRSSGVVNEVPHAESMSTSGPASADLDRVVVSGTRVIEISTGRFADLPSNASDLSMSRNGRWITALVGVDQYRYDVDDLLAGGAGARVLVSLSDDEKQGDNIGNCSLGGQLYQCHNAYGRAAINDTGDLVVFSSQAPLTAADEAVFEASGVRRSDVFLRDITAGTTTLVSHDDSSGLPVNSETSLVGASADLHQIVMIRQLEVWTRTVDVTPPAPTDGIAPTVIGSASPGPNPAGWWNTPVTVTWSANDPAPSSGLGPIPAPTVVSGEGRNQTVTSPPVCDVAANCSTGSVTVSIDTTRPTLTVTAPTSVAPKDTVTIACSAADALSGIATTCANRSFPATNLVAGINTITFSATDAAGNVATKSVNVKLVVTTATITDLIRVYLGNSNGAAGLLKSFKAKLTAGDLRGFIDHVNAQCCTPARGKRFTAAQASTLTALASQILGGHPKPRRHEKHHDGREHRGHHS